MHGYSPRQIVESILSAADDGRSMTESEPHERIRNVKIVIEVLDQLREMRIGFCDATKVER